MIDTKEIRERYISENLDSTEDPDLKEYAKEYGIDYKTLKTVATKGNWFAWRSRAKNRYLLAVQDEQDKAIAKAAVDIAKTRTDFLAQSLVILSQDLPKLRQEVLARMETMDDKALVALYKMIAIDLKKHVETMLVELDKKTPDKVSDQTGLDLGLNAVIIQKITQTQVNEYEGKEEELNQTFQELEERGQYIVETDEQEENDNNPRGSG